MPRRLFSLLVLLVASSRVDAACIDPAALADSTVSITRYFDDFGWVNRTINVATQSTSQATYNQTLDKAIGAMRAARGLKLGQDNDFEIYSNDTLVSAFAEVARQIRIGAFVVSAIALLAAGIGIMNIMLVSVTERTREIGVRMAVGAKPRHILMQFLTEALSLAFAGGLLGVALGVGAAARLARGFGWPMLVRLDVIAVAVGFASLVGVVFGLYPARKASRLDPILALRYE